MNAQEVEDKGKKVEYFEDGKVKAVIDEERVARFKEMAADGKVFTWSTYMESFTVSGFYDFLAVYNKINTEELDEETVKLAYEEYKKNKDENDGGSVYLKKRNSSATLAQNQTTE
jgi:hypothetical protein